jgi:hypothetical protein
MEELENLRPMSRSEFEILYNRCAKSGWVKSNINLEILYNHYLQRHGYFLYYIIVLKYQMFIENNTLINVNEDNFNLIDNGGFPHPINLPNLNLLQKNLPFNNTIHLFLAEAPNTFETYVYNPIRTATQYYNWPLTFLRGNNWLDSNILLLDFFPFPIKGTTTIRKRIVQKGYTFRMHLSQYFKPYLEAVLNFLEIDRPQPACLIAPPYTSIHAILELEDDGWNNLIILNHESNFKDNIDVTPFGFDAWQTPILMYNAFINLREQQSPYLGTYINDIPAYYQYIKSRIYCDGTNYPGQRQN